MSDPKREVEELRQEIARLDAQLLSVLEKRAKAARRIGELRKDQAVGWPSADRAALAAIVARASGDMPVEAVRAIFREIFASSMALELPVPIAFVGPEGSAGHAAARERFGAASNCIATEGAAEALDEVTRHRADFAVVPLETRADGLVQPTIVALTSSDLKIIAAFETSSNLQLMNKTGNLGDIEEVYVTSADHALCERFLASIGVGAAPSSARGEGPPSRGSGRVRVLDVKTPLVACRLASEDHGAAAIAIESFGAQHGLEVAKRNVLDGGDLRARYAVVGVRPSSRTGNDATAIVFGVPDSPGALLDVLKQFAERQINLTKIQSRPAGEGWAYVFFAELAGHMTDRAIVTALEDVKKLTKSFKVLGSYPTL